VSVFNRRNAAVGWLALTVGKRVLKRKTKDVVPAVARESKRPTRGAIALLAAGAVGVLTLRRKRSGGGPPGEE